MSKSHESALYLVEKHLGSKNGVTAGVPLVFRTRAKAREYAKSKSAKSRTYVYTVRVAKWGPENAR